MKTLRVGQLGEACDKSRLPKIPVVARFGATGDEHAIERCELAGPPRGEPRLVLQLRVPQGSVTGELTSLRTFLLLVKNFFDQKAEPQEVIRFLEENEYARDLLEPGWRSPE